MPNNINNSKDKKEKRENFLVRFLTLIILILIIILVFATCPQNKDSGTALQSNIRFEEDNPWDGVVNNGGSTDNSEDIGLPGYTN